MYEVWIINYGSMTEIAEKIFVNQIDIRVKVILGLVALLYVGSKTWKSLSNNALVDIYLLLCMFAMYSIVIFADCFLDVCYAAAAITSLIVGSKVCSMYSKVCKRACSKAYKKVVGEQSKKSLWQAVGAWLAVALVMLSVGIFAQAFYHCSAVVAILAAILAVIIMVIIAVAVVATVALRRYRESKR
jgi:hypothetical protein